MTHKNIKNNVKVYALTIDSKDILIGMFNKKRLQDVFVFSEEGVLRKRNEAYPAFFATTDLFYSFEIKENGLFRIEVDNKYYLVKDISFEKCGRDVFINIGNICFIN